MRGHRHALPYVILGPKISDFFLPNGVKILTKVRALQVTAMYMGMKASRLKQRDIEGHFLGEEFY